MRYLTLSALAPFPSFGRGVVSVSAAYVDEHVEARYEEIINHLHRALSSTEEDERDFKVKKHNKIV